MKGGHSRCSFISIIVVAVLIACSFFVIDVEASAEVTPPSSQTIILDQDFSALGAVPENLVLANNLEAVVTASLSYSGTDRAIEYKTTGTQSGSVFVGIDPFVDGTLSIGVKVSSDNKASGLYITGSTFQVYAQTLANGNARVYSQYFSSPTQISYRSYDVPVKDLVNEVNTINIEVSGTSKSVTVYHDATRKVITPLHSWNVQNLPYDPLTLPIVKFTNEKSSRATYVSTYLYGLKESVNGGPVTPAPGGDLVPFGIDVPRAEGNQNGATYMAERGYVGVVWADEYYLENLPQVIPFQQALLKQGWELGIHYSKSLNTLSTAEALAYMKEVYNKVYKIFGQAPTSWCSLENKDNLTHAHYAYESLGMLWRNAQWYIPNGGSLVENTWPAFWNQISVAQLVTPAFTHFTDQTGTVSAYAIGYGHFTTWVNNYAGKSIIGFNEYYHRVANQVDTKIQYQSYIPGEELNFTVQCNEFPSRLLIDFSGAGDAVIKRNGAVLSSSDYQIIGDDRIVLLARSGDQFEISTALPSVPLGLMAASGDALVDLAWSAPLDDGGSMITGYKVYRGTDAGAGTLLATLGIELSYTDDKVTNGQTYYYSVSAVTASGEGLRTKEVLATPATVPSAPQILDAVGGNAQVTLTWLPPSSDGGSPITSYKIYRGGAPGEGTLLATLGNVLTYTDTSVINGQTYYYMIRAVNGVEVGPGSAEVSAKPMATVPSPPTNLIAIPGDAQVVLSWSEPSDGGSPITGYSIYRGITPGDRSFSVTIGNVLGYTDTMLSNDVTYYYTVSATNSVGNGPPTSEVAAIPIAPATLPASPQGLTAVGGDARVTLIWSAPTSDGGSSITAYKIYRGTMSGGETLLTTVGNVLTYVDSGVINGVIHYYVVSAVNGIGEGPKSSESSATPLAPPSKDFNYVLINSGTEVEITGYHGTSKAMVIPSMIEGKSVTSIGARAFYQNVSLNSATIPGTVLSIGDYAFLGCTGLNSVTIYDGVVSIGEAAFAYCSGMTQVTVPASVTYIGGYAFYGCAGLTTVVLAGGTTSIGARAFYQDAALASVTVLGRITAIGEAAFAYCSSLTSVTFTGGVGTIGNYAFYGCSRLGSIVMIGTTSIGNYAFYQCSGLISMYFDGNAPNVGTGWIGARNANLVIYYYEGATGFTTPTWQGIATVSLPRI